MCLGELQHLVLCSLSHPLFLLVPVCTHTCTGTHTHTHSLTHSPTPPTVQESLYDHRRKQRPGKVLCRRFRQAWCHCAYGVQKQRACRGRQTRDSAAGRRCRSFPFFPPFSWSCPCVTTTLCTLYSCHPRLLTSLPFAHFTPICSLHSHVLCRPLLFTWSTWPTQPPWLRLRGNLLPVVMPWMCSSTMQAACSTSAPRQTLAWKQTLPSTPLVCSSNETVNVCACLRARVRVEVGRLLIEWIVNCPVFPCSTCPPFLRIAGRTICPDDLAPAGAEKSPRPACGELV